MAYDALTTVASLKAWLKTPGDNDDGILGDLINVASDLIGRYCARDNLGKVYDYSENYFKKTSGISSKNYFDIVLRHYPVTAITQVMMSGAVIPVIDSAGIQANQSGVFLVEDVEPRILRFNYLSRTGPIWIQYSAGYAFDQIPTSLAQAANQYAGEIMRSQAWIGKKSQGAVGETTTYDIGESWGVSKRVQALLQPYRNVDPFMGFG
jgi:hypothetical protein